MWLRANASLAFDITEPTPFILMLRPRSGWQQWVAREEYHVTSDGPITEYTDIYGNLCQRLVAPPGDFEISTMAEVRVSPQMDRAPGAPFIEVQNLPDAVLDFLLPSRYCESDRFNLMAMEITAGALPGYNQVEAIVAWIRDRIRFDPGSSDVPVSAVEVNQRGVGVCRDLSHLAIAMCRSMSIPARLVVGYLHGLEPMDMHAWFEVYVGWRWYTFDPTPVSVDLEGGYIAVGYGRDAADVALYTQFGLPVYPRHHRVSVEKIDRNDK